MGFAINTNNDALNTYRNLNTVQNSLSKSLERLSSGLRINQAGDDAAGLTIATQLGSQVSGLQQASRNAQDGVSVLQTADGGLQQAQSLLGRLRDLAVQAANDSNSTKARDAIAAEATSLVSELDRLGDSVNFNGSKLLAGVTGNASIGSLQFQIGADGDSASRVGVNLTSADLKTIATGLNASSSASYAVTNASLTASKYTFTTGNTSVDVTLGTAASNATDLAAKLNANSEFAGAFTASTNTAGTALIVSSKLGTAMSTTVAPGAGVASGGAVTSATLQFDTATNAQAAIATINTKIEAISSARAQIGAQQNRFASAVSTIATSVQNLTAAKSRITDVDMAQEMVNYTRANVLSQSGTAMLAQANSLPQLALKLLG